MTCLNRVISDMRQNVIFEIIRQTSSESIPEVAAAIDRKQKTDLKPDRRRSCQQEARISEELPSIPLNWSSVLIIFNI